MLPEAANLAAHGLFIVIALAALTLKSPRVQLGLALVGLAILSGYIGMLFTTLS